MSLKNIITYILVVAVITFSSCDIKNNNFEPSEGFAKIYDDDRFEQEYYPLSIIQTSDEGYLVLSELKNSQALFNSVYVLKIDPSGEVEQASLLGDPYGLPVKGWSEINGQYYFVCMNSSTLAAQVVAVDPDGSLGDPVSIAGTTYPLVSAQDGNNILLLSFDNLDGESVLSIVGTDGTVTSQASYSIGAGVDVDKPIIDHLTGNRAKIPFSVGKASTGYFFNGFYNYTFSMVFSNFGNDPTGVCQGQLSSGGISNVLSLGSNNYAVARYNFGDSFINPMVSIASSQITSSVDLGGNTFPEIENSAGVTILQDEESQKLLYGTHTNSRRIVLYAYDNADASLLATEYLGAGNPYLFADLAFTTDGGCVVLTQVALEDRFPRIAIFKRNKEFLDNLFN